jgi:hypothetical protein
MRRPLIFAASCLALLLLSGCGASSRGRGTPDPADASAIVDLRPVRDLRPAPDFSVPDYSIEDGDVDHPAPPADISMQVDLSKPADFSLPDANGCFPTLSDPCNGVCCMPYICHTFGCISLDGGGFYCPSVCVGFAGTPCKNGFDCLSATCQGGSCL